MTFLVEVQDMEPGFEGSAIFGPFPTREAAEKAAEKERAQIAKCMIRPDFFSVTIRAGN